MTNRKNYWIIAALFIASCNANHSHPEDAITPIVNGTEQEEVALTIEQAENIGIEYGRIEERSLKSTIKLIGRIELPPTGRNTVSSKIDGEVISVHIIEGERIKKGQRIFTIQNLELIEWQEEWKSLKSKIKYLDNEIVRQKQLSDESLAPLKNYEMLISDREQAMYKSSAIEEKLKTLGKSIDTESDFSSTYSVRATAGGVLQKLIVNKGAYITKGDELAQIIDNHHLHIHLSVYSEDVRKLKVGQLIHFNVQSDPNKLLTAHIKWIDAFVNNENNSYQVHAEVEGEDYNLAVGEFVEARVISSQEKVKSLPESAITQDKGLYYIFAKEDQHEDEIHFLKIQIKLGEKDMGFVEVLPIDNIPEGIEVVTNGAFFLMAQTKKGEEGAGHSH